MVADVHTQPADEAGNIVGKVLHVGTGWPRTLVVTVDTCVGPRAYVGLASSYYEETTSDFQRLTDTEWGPALQSAPPAEVEWMADIVTP
jgi:hypothetical protein